MTGDLYGTRQLSKGQFTDGKFRMSASVSRPEVPIEEYGEQYFKRYNYADRPLSRFSMYWFARRYYAALIRRYAPKDVPKADRRLLELGCGLGHLIGLLQDEYHCVGIDLADY